MKTAGDRIRHSDLDAYLLYNGGSVSAARHRAPAPDETIKVVGLRRKIAENMAEANRRIQHFTLVEEYDVTALEETRRDDEPRPRLQPQADAAAVPDHGDVARRCAEWPMLNATFDDEAMVVTRHGSVQMGVATQTPNGLMVADDPRRAVALGVGAGVARSCASPTPRAPARRAARS